MNDWYIDRSKNFINETLDEFLCFLNEYNGERDSASIITAMNEKMLFEGNNGNPNAALTRFRDHGLINSNNSLGDSARDYVEGILTKNELIIDLLSKRPPQKKNASNVKPFFLLCKVFDMMYSIALTNDDVYLTYKEIYSYLFPIVAEEEISFDLIEGIWKKRDERITENNVHMKQNEITNLSIWCNALKNTSLFIENGEKNVLFPNQYSRTFFDFISRHSFMVSATPTDSNDKLYDYYCDGNSGISEVIPYMFKDMGLFRSDEEIPYIMNYLFGIKKEYEFDFSYYFEQDCFGIYNSFVSMPGLVIRKIMRVNRIIGEKMLEYINASGIYR